MLDEIPEGILKAIGLISMGGSFQGTGLGSKKIIVAQRCIEVIHLKYVQSGHPPQSAGTSQTFTGENFTYGTLRKLQSDLSCAT